VRLERTHLQLVSQSESLPVESLRAIDIPRRLPCRQLGLKPQRPALVPTLAVSYSQVQRALGQLAGLRRLTVGRMGLGEPAAPQRDLGLRRARRIDLSGALQEADAVVDAPG